MQEGHCHFAADHGTERQWAVGAAQPKKEPAVSVVRCPNCGGENPEFAEICGHCGRDLDSIDWSEKEPEPSAQQYTPHSHAAPPPFNTSFQAPFQVGVQDPYGGVPRTEEIDGITVDEIVELVGPNSAYYLPQFLHMSRTGKKVSWNGAGFLLPHNWLLFRKNLLWGILASVLWCILWAVNYGLYFVADSPASLPLETQKLVLLISSLAFLVEILLRLAVGLFGNYAYMQLILDKARKLRTNPQPQYNRSFRVSGGTSFALALLPYALPFLLTYCLLLFAPIP